MDDPETSDTRNGHRATATVLSSLVIIYFLFPFAYALPLMMIYGKRRVPPPGFRMLFAPVNYLDQHVPAYHALMEKEEKWTGLH